MERDGPYRHRRRRATAGAGGFSTRRRQIRGRLHRCRRFRRPPSPRFSSFSSSPDVDEPPVPEPYRLAVGRVVHSHGPAGILPVRRGVPPRRPLVLYPDLELFPLIADRGWYPGARGEVIPLKVPYRLVDEPYRAGVRRSVLGGDGYDALRIVREGRQRRRRSGGGAMYATYADPPDVPPSPALGALDAPPPDLPGRRRRRRGVIRAASASASSAARRIRSVAVRSNFAFDNDERLQLLPDEAHDVRKDETVVGAGEGATVLVAHCCCAVDASSLSLVPHKAGVISGRLVRGLLEQS
mmetsp:Transcript_22906/g.67637  ORF Transcript_22906/g.67637 Transcript_22906/m.67637 type:complete len:297 (-) Transcript_22906:19-909(-)